MKFRILSRVNVSTSIRRKCRKIPSSSPFVENENPTNLWKRVRRTNDKEISNFAPLFDEFSALESHHNFIKRLDRCSRNATAHHILFLASSIPPLPSLSSSHRRLNFLNWHPLVLRHCSLSSSNPPLERAFPMMHTHTLYISREGGRVWNDVTEGWKCGEGAGMVVEGWE